MEFLVALPPKLIQPFYFDFSLWSCNSVKFTNWVPLLKENPLLTHHLLNRLIKTYSIHDSRSICNANDHIHSTYILLILVYWIRVTLSHHFMALPVNLECCRPCHLLQNYQITQPVFVGGCWVLADVCTGSHSALKWMLNNNKKLVLHDDKKKLLPQFTQHLCIKGVVQYYCSSTT